MAVFLLDINLLLALAWPTHPQHNAAHRWLSGISTADSWATCPITQCGFVRISSNPKFTPDALAPAAAIVLLETIVKQPAHTFWQDDVAITDSIHMPRKALQGHRQITDAYLFALSKSRGGKLATLDQGIASLAATQTELEAIVVVNQT